MRLFRYEVYGDYLPPGVGMFQGLRCLGGPREKLDSLMEAFDHLEVPDIYKKFPSMDFVSFFTEEGNREFQSDIIRIAVDLRDSGYDVKCCSVDLPESYWAEIAYRDDYQVYISEELYRGALAPLVTRESFPSAEYCRGPFRLVHPEMIGDIYHVGTMDISKKRRHSHEGDGLSISNCPDEWVAITEGFTYGDYFRLSKPGMKLLDYYGLTDEERKVMQAWAVENGYVVDGTLYKSITWGEEGEDYYSLFDSYEVALQEADDEEERVVEMPGLLPTEKLLERSLVQVELLHVPDIVAALYAEQVLGLDGIWWDEELDVGAYSAPRGVIFNSRLDGFQVVNITKEMENDEMDKNGQAVGVRADVVWFRLSEDFCVSAWYVPDDGFGERLHMKLELVGEDGYMGPACELVHDESYATADLSFEAICDTLNEVVVDARFACESGDLDGICMDGLVDLDGLARDILREFGLEYVQDFGARCIVADVLSEAKRCSVATERGTRNLELGTRERGL